MCMGNGGKRLYDMQLLVTSFRYMLREVCQLQEIYRGSAEW